MSGFEANAMVAVHDRRVPTTGLYYSFSAYLDDVDLLHMKVVIAGGTGFLGQPLAARLAADGHPITVLTRRMIQGSTAHDVMPAATGDIALVEWQPDGTTAAWSRTIDGANAVASG